MSFSNSKWISRSLLETLRVKTALYHQHKIPKDIPIIVISNHRSFLDAPLLIEAIPTRLRIACHHYMGKTPGLKEIIKLLDCFPLATSKQKQQHFFDIAEKLLDSQQWVGLFPEGAQPMVEPTMPGEIGKFQRGFAHLAYRLPVDNLAVLPVAIASIKETIYPTFPIRWLSMLDGSEPFFQQDGLHPLVIYHSVKVLFGDPYLITAEDKACYSGKSGIKLANDLVENCETQIRDLLQAGCYGQ